MEIEIDNLLPEDIVESYYYAWSDDYKEAKEALYERDFRKAIVLLQKRGCKRTCSGSFMIWVIYINMVEEYRLIWNWRMNIIEKHLQGSWRFMKEKDSGNAKTRYKEGYIQYRIGKCYDQAKGVDQTMQRQGNGMKRL